MITQQEHEFATEALCKAERLLGAIMVAVTSDAPTLKARVMAQALVTAGLLTKLGRSRTHIPNNFGATVDELMAQLIALWVATDEQPDDQRTVDPDLVTFPDGANDYINLVTRAEETTQ